MKKILFLFLTFTFFFGHSQNKKTEKIIEEGKMLARLEKGSWFGTDDFFERFPSKRDSIGGYVSYQDENKKIITLFYKRSNPEEIVVRYTFHKNPLIIPEKIDTINKQVTPLEKDLIAINSEARKTVMEDSEGFFSHYENTSFNFIPIISKKQKRVFILTGPQTNGIVIIGNDYVLEFDKKNTLKRKTKLHNSILHFPYQSENQDSPIESTMHSHVLDDFITSTDICTFLLYKDFVEWDQHIVISKKQVSFFNLKEETLFTMKRKDWEKIANSTKE